MNEIVVERNISLDPELVNENIVENIYNNLLKKFKGTCDQQNGYIIDVKKDIKILGNKISSSGPNVFFAVTFTAKVIMPKKDKECSGVIKICVSGGIVVAIEGVLDVFVPAGDMAGYTFSDGCFQKKMSKLRQGSTVTIIMKDVKYEKDKFICTGKLK
jgi:DNA-directed RNA polymerase subunit E'/Rpb7